MTAHALALTLLAAATLVPSPRAQSDASATLKGTTLVLTGGAGVDDLTLSTSAMDAGNGAVGGDVVVTPHGASTVNGSSDPFVAQGVLKLKVNLGEGDDLLEFQDYDLAGASVTVRGGGGADHLTLGNATTGAFTFFGDAGNDTFEGGACTLGVTKVVAGPGTLGMPCTGSFFSGLTVVGGSGVDNLTWNQVTVDFTFKLRLSAGSDVFDSTEGTVGTVSTLNLGPGDDQFHDDMGLFGEFVNLVTGSGNDGVEFRDSTIGNGLNIKLGSGLNQLDLVAQDGQLVIGNDLVIKGGSSLDAVMLQQGIGPSNIVLVGNDLVIKLAAGENELAASGDVGIGNDLRYAGGGLDDVVDLDGTDIGNDARIDLAAGTNDVILNDCTVGNDLRITAGNGDDTVALTGTTNVGDKVLIHLGGGNNSGP